jgi:hypothetical protein
MHHLMSTSVQRRPAAAPRQRHTLKPAAITAAAVFALGAAPAAGYAQESASPRISFDGFGTVGVAYATDENADFVENPLRSEGTGHSSRLGAPLDSRIAGQLTLQATSRITGVLQVVVEQGQQGRYEPAVEWANLSYAFTPDASLRAGRIVMPLFLVTEARKVSYANPWVRPPVELYSLVPIYAWDGVDASFRRRIGDWTGSVNAALGRASADMEGGDVEAEHFWNVNAAMARGEFTGRVALMSGEVTVEAYAPLFEAFRGFGAEGEAIASQYEADGRRISFATAGLQYDPGRFFSMAELGWLDTQSAMGERMAGHVTGGIHLGAVAPFVTYARAALLSESSAAGLTLEGLPPEAAQAGAALNAGLNTLLGATPVQQNLTLGTRWDVAPGFALKGQVEFIDRLERSPGTFTNFQPTFEPGGSTRLVSVAATFVF